MDEDSIFEVEDLFNCVLWIEREAILLLFWLLLITSTVVCKDSCNKYIVKKFK